MLLLGPKISGHYQNWIIHFTIYTDMIKGVCNCLEMNSHLYSTDGWTKQEQIPYSVCRAPLGTALLGSVVGSSECVNSGLMDRYDVEGRTYMLLRGLKLYVLSVLVNSM